MKRILALIWILGGSVLSLAQVQLTKGVQVGGTGSGGATLPVNQLVFGLSSTTSRGASASDIQTLIQAQAGCSISGNFWNPATNTCSAASSISGQTISCAVKATSSTGSSGSLPICDDGTTTTFTHPTSFNDGTGKAGYIGLMQGLSQSVRVNSIGFTAPALVTGYNLLYPAAQGAGALTNDGSGNLTWNPSGSGGNPSDCSASTTTNICLNLAPYYASPDGATTTTLTANLTSGSTMATVGSCSTFAANQGVYIAGAGAAGAQYIGKVTSCGGTTMQFTPATATSVSSGAAVWHDETHAFQQALTDCDAGATHSCTIWLPPLATNGSTADYRSNGPLQNTGTANAIIQLPSVANYGSQTDVIAIKGFNEPSQSNAGMGPIIETEQNSGNFFGAYDGATGGGYPPFTAVNFSLENAVVQCPTNPSITCLNFPNAYSFQGTHVLIRTVAATVPTSGTGKGLVMPLILNNVENQLNDVIAAGFGVGVQLTEHTSVGWMEVANNTTGIVIDVGSNATQPAQYKGNPQSFGYIWCGFNTTCLAAGSNDTMVSGLAIGSELNTTDISDPSNHLRGHIQMGNPYGPTHALNITGAANLTVFDLWNNMYVTPLNIHSNSGGLTPPVGAEDTDAIAANSFGITSAGVAPNMATGSYVRTLLGHDAASLYGSAQDLFGYVGASSTSNFWWKGMHTGTGGTQPPYGICGNALGQVGVGFHLEDGCPTTADFTISGKRSANTMINVTAYLTWTGCAVSNNACTVATPGTTISASAIPSGMNNLMIVVNGRTDEAATTSDIYIQFNADTTANYSRQYLFAQGASTAAGQGNGLTNAPIGGITGSLSVANMPGDIEVKIPNYSGAAFLKMIYSTSALYSNNTTTGLESIWESYYWNSSAPITQFLLAPVTGSVNFVAGTKVEAYAY